MVSSAANGTGRGEILGEDNRGRPTRHGRFPACFFRSSFDSVLTTPESMRDHEHHRGDAAFASGPFYAHSKQRTDRTPAPLDEWEPLFTPLAGESGTGCGKRNCPRCASLEPDHGHLNKVAWWTAKFAGEMFPEGSDRETARQWGYIAGLWHDLGKFSREFQSYLRQAGGDSHEGDTLGRVDHSTAGAREVARQFKVLGHFLAYGIAGHHSGLLDGEKGASQRLRLLKQDLPPIPSAPSEVTQQAAPDLPGLLAHALRDPKSAGFSSQFFTRMLFSCLVDADFLATEAFMNPAQAARRNEAPADVLNRIAGAVAARIEKFGIPKEGDTVNLKRAEVVTDCATKAEDQPGLFTLTVPTGGGKTLASLLFATRHAVKHGQRRIIYVAPFTSIIEQNADVIRDIVQPLESDGFTPLIEHHSSLSPDKETLQSRLAAENWDAPIVVTTAVQFYESLFAAKTSRSRKLHNIANAVVILDEAQTLPVSFLAPCLRVLRELADNYQTTVILCTATQPAIGFHETDFPIGLNLKDREIVSDTRPLFAALKRVEITRRGELTDSALTAELREHSSALCIVNRREHARKLFQMLGEEEGNYHLSALMCPEHRSRVFAEIRTRLAAKLPTRVISTQLIEAGVDVDFPVVYRALAGLDSIAQAAGRCNRHGRMETPGRVFVFKPEDTKGEAFFRDTAQVAAQVLKLESDLLGEDAMRRYFDLYYYRNKQRWDEKHILDRFQLRPGCREFPLAFDFASAARDFQMIDDWQKPVIVPFDDKARELIKQLRNPTIPLHRDLLRGLQRYTVQISPRLLSANANSFEHLRDDQFHALISPELNYSNHFGLTLDDKHANSRPLIA
jgi:CRISPR-associated endonuclease/helicase Cas3